MKCEIGDHEIKGIIFSLTNIEHEGRQINFACQECLKTIGLFCDKHFAAKTGYADGYACIMCIHIVKERYRGRGREFFEDLKTQLRPDVWHELLGFLDYGDWVDQPWRELRLLTELSRCAHCRRISVENALRELIKTQDLNVLFPNPLEKIASG